ncbi:MAG: two-component system sensor histidine kinase AdeS [Flavobacteriaceae bacterium]|jgi:two-component system sensor histidine kinase AdeS
MIHRRRLHLRTQFSIAMVLTSVTALAIFIFGMLGFYIYVQERWVETLSVNNRETLKALIGNENVDAEALTTLVNVFSISWAEGYAIREVTVLLIFVLISVVCAIFVGMIVARRLSQPIESVTHAALQVASGEFNYQVDQTLAASLEAHDLLLSFNKMTQYLESAEREATESVAAITHELRTPLTVLRGRLQGMSDGTFKASEDLLQALIGQVDTLACIVNDLETISRLDSGGVKYQEDVINLADVALSVVTSMARDIEVNGVVLEYDLQPAYIKGDGPRIRQALNALIENAKQYGSPGKYVRVETGINGNNGYLKVLDKGPGICEEDRERVFDRWWRAEKSRSRITGGSGLGLSVVKSITRAHTGNVRIVDGPDGQGTAVVISIPLTNDQ